MSGVISVTSWTPDIAGDVVAGDTSSNPNFWDSRQGLMLDYRPLGIPLVKLGIDLEWHYQPESIGARGNLLIRGNSIVPLAGNSMGGATSCGIINRAQGIAHATGCTQWGIVALNNLYNNQGSTDFMVSDIGSPSLAAGDNIFLTIDDMQAPGSLMGWIEFFTA